MKAFLKSAAVVPICFVTWFCTSPLMVRARQPGTPGKPAPARKAIANVQVRPAKQEAMPKLVTSLEALKGISAKPGKTDNLSASGGFKSSKIDVVDEIALVHAQAILTDGLRKDLYVWRLSFLNAQGQVVDQILYDGQVFEMEPDFEMEPTFDEVVPIPAGSSVVKLSLMAFRPGTDMGGLRDPEASLGYTILSTSKRL